MTLQIQSSAVNKALDLHKENLLKNLQNPESSPLYITISFDISKYTHSPKNILNGTAFIERYAPSLLHMSKLHKLETILRLF